MNVDIQEIGTALIARVQGDVGEVGLATFEEALRKMAERNPSGAVIDFSEVTFIGSTGLAILIKFAREMRKQEKQVHVAGATKNVQGVLRMVNLHSMVAIDESVDAAVKALR
jgi:anti-anti-sigma factor